MVGGRRGGLLQNLTFPIIFWVMKPGSTQGSGTGELGGGHSVERPCKVPRVRQIQVQTLSPPSAVGARENNGASLSLNDLS